ncbi:MAG: YbjN domain-containing protein [Planctomycetia bacterium]|nr:YbjN domain-containing protein [Planctomycetia bacterium]
MSYSNEIVEAVKTFFNEDDWHYEFDEENGIFSGGINIKSKLASVNFFLRVKEEDLINSTQIQIKAEESVRNNVGEYLTRVNYGLIFGCFEMDYQDGEIQYRMSASLAELQADCKKTMCVLLGLPCKMFERYGDGLLAVMFGMETPEEALANVRKK